MVFVVVLVVEVVDVVLVVDVGSGVVSLEVLVVVVVFVVTSGVAFVVETLCPPRSSNTLILSNVISIFPDVPLRSPSI